MNLIQNKRCHIDRRGLATQALQAAVATRAQAKCDQCDPICIYDLCETLGIIVRFNNINMEAMYQSGVPPRIHLSARRPLPRRTFNCAHELGHHVFGHGSTIDELREEAQLRSWENPREFLVDAFAGFILMPIIGLRRAFSVRKWALETATPTQIYTVACEFGVGYSTLLTHLSNSVGLLPRARYAALQRVTPKAIRREIIGVLTPDPLIIADHHSTSPTLDTEVNTLLLLPRGTVVIGGGLVFDSDLEVGRLFRAVKSGVFQARADGWTAFVRVARTQKDQAHGYVGLARYRHLEEDLSPDGQS